MSRKSIGILAAAAAAALLSGAAFSQERFGAAALLGDPLPADGPVDKVVTSGAIDRDLYVYVAPDNLFTSGD